MSIRIDDPLLMALLAALVVSLLERGVSWARRAVCRVVKQRIAQIEGTLPITVEASLRLTVRHGNLPVAPPRSPHRPRSRSRRRPRWWRERESG